MKKKILALYVALLSPSALALETRDDIGFLDLAVGLQNEVDVKGFEDVDSSMFGVGGNIPVGDNLLLGGSFARVDTDMKHQTYKYELENVMKVYGLSGALHGEVGNNTHAFLTVEFSAGSSTLSDARRNLAASSLYGKDLGLRLEHRPDDKTTIYGGLEFESDRRVTNTIASPEESEVTSESTELSIDVTYRANKKLKFGAGFAHKIKDEKTKQSNTSSFSVGTRFFASSRISFALSAFFDDNSGGFSLSGRYHFSDQWGG